MLISDSDELASCKLKRQALLQADEPLGTFMDYCTYGYMIDNIVLIVTGTLHERNVQVKKPSDYAIVYQIA